MLPADVARCGDSFGCPLADDCARNVPPANTERVPYALFNGQRIAEGDEACLYYVQKEPA